MDIYDVVTKLIGPIMPIGETNTDEKRFENLQEMVSLVNELLDDIHSVTVHKTRGEWSMKHAGEYADKTLKEIGEGYAAPK